MERTLTLTAPLLLALLGLAGCGMRDDSPARTETRTVDAFDAIELEGAANLEVTVGGDPTVELAGRGLERVGTTVSGQRLVIEAKRGWWERSGGELRVRIAVPQLKSVAVNGAGQVRLTGLSGSEFALELSGAGDVNGSGNVERLRIEMNGAGNVDFQALTTVDATVEVNGAGNVDLTATGRLDATVNGVGSVRYGGPPSQVKSQLNGIGSIRAR